MKGGKESVAAVVKAAGESVGMPPDQILELCQRLEEHFVTDMGVLEHMDSGT